MPIKRFNKDHPGLTVKKFELAADATEVRNQFIQRAQAKSPECDVLQGDIIWTAEFAQQKWIMDLSDYMEDRKSEFIPSTLKPYEYDGKLWGARRSRAPGCSTGARIRWPTCRRPGSSCIPRAPSTTASRCRGRRRGPHVQLHRALQRGGWPDPLRGRQEGGARLAGEPEGAALLAAGYKDGGLVKATNTYMEEQARTSFESGKATFMRNWSYAYALAKKAPKVKNHFEISPLPPFEGGGKGGVLGGNGPLITASTDNPKGALLWLDYWSSKETIDRDAAQYALPPTLLSSYDEPEVKKALPYSAELLNAVKEAVPRPVSPVYPQISEAVFKNVNKALTGQMSPEDALKKGQDQIEKALSSF